MKKALSLLLALVLCLSLCACGGEITPDTPTVSNTLPTQTEPQVVGNEYVGNWVADDADYRGYSCYIRFLSNGQAIFGSGGSDYVNTVDHASVGQWFIDGNEIYLTYAEEGINRAYIFTICDGYIEGCSVISSIYTVKYYKVN